jgi:hypothetical protein
MNIWRISFVWAVFAASFTTSLSAQQVALVPPAGVNADGTTTIQLMFKPSKTVEFGWASDLTGKNVRLLIGRSKGDYSLTSVPVSGLRTRTTAAALGLPTGRYYVRLSNSTARTVDGIIADPMAGKIFSNEVEFIVEATQAPKVNTPRGTVTEATPLFSWDPVPGVPAYWIIFSSTPFTITTDANDQIKIEGANVVWQIITNSTSARYGDVNPNVTYYDIDAPPLNPGQEYSFAILNIYEPDNPVYASPVFGGIVPMRYENPNAIPKPTLIQPAPGAVYNAAETITFRWSEVTQAASYGINLYQVIVQQGVNATVPIWSTVTTNTVIDYPALSNLKNAVYQWNVVAFDGEGGGVTSGTSASPTREFQYRVVNGEFSATAASTLNPSKNMSGVEIYIRAISGGVTPGFPAFLQSESVADSLVVGTYQFTAKKDGFADTTVTQTILARRTSYIAIKMRPLPSFISGVVADERRVPVAQVNVSAANQLTGVVVHAQTDVTGTFRMPANPGTYEVKTSKAGTIAPLPRVITIQQGEAYRFPDSLRITNDRATIAGAVLNESGGPVQNARVIVRKGTEVFETRTDGTGVYSLVLGSGIWLLSAEKSGFVPSSGRNITLTAGDQLQNQNITLAGRANTISGFVRERTSNADGTTGFSPRSGATVTATPLAGQAVSVQTSSNGQYTLSLGSGTYTITVAFSGYSVLETPPQMVLGFGETYSGVNFSLQSNPSTVSGKITAPDGTPVSGVTIASGNAAQVLSNASGLYTLALPAGNHSLSASRPGYVTPASRSVGLTAGQTLSGIDFVMSANAATVSGTVSSAGSTVSQATVMATSARYGTVIVSSGNTGGYSMGLQPGEWQIAVSKNNFANIPPITVTLAAGQSRSGTDFVLTPSVRTLRGIVTDGVNPLRNVEVVFVSGVNTITTYSQPNGTFSASLASGVSWNITLRLNGYRTRSFSIPVIEPSAEPLQQNAVLEPSPASISGTVSDENLRVIGDAKIVVLVQDASSRVDSTTAGSNGIYHIGLPSGNYVLRASKPGYATEDKQISLNVGAAVSGVHFSLEERFALLSGTVVSSGSSPVEGAIVVLNGQDGSLRTAQSDQNGAFTISSLVSGTYTVSIQKTGFSAPAQTVFTLSGGQQRTIRFEMTPNAGSIAGKVSDLTGTAIAFAEVTAVGGVGQVQTITNAQGDYRFASLPLGVYTISAAKSGYTSLETISVSISAENPEQTGQQFSNLIRNNGSIRGNVTDLADNSRLPNVNVQLSGVRGSGSAITSSTGAFEIQNLAPGSYTAVFSVNGWEPDTVRVDILPEAPQVSLDRQLARNAGRLAGSVVNQRGEIIDFRPVIKLESAAATYTTRADAAGKFTFDNIKTGVSYTLSTDIYRDGYQNAVRQVSIPRGTALLELQDPLRVRFNGAAILGNVALPGVTVQLITANSSTASQLFTSESDGTFRFRFLPEGNYRVVARQPGFVFSPDTAKISLGFNEQRVLAISAIQNVGNIQITTNRAGGVLMSGVQVTVVSTDTTIIRTLETGDNGIALFQNLPAGKTYKVRVNRAGFSIDPEVREIALGTAATVNAAFSLIPNTSAISGRVIDKSGTGLSEAIIRARLLATNQIFEQRTGKDGTFNVNGIPSGLYRITARKSGYNIDTLFNISVSQGQVVTNRQFTLDLAALNYAYGVVSFAGRPVSGVQVTAISNGQFTTTTGTNGQFFFHRLPVKPGTTDTTVYAIQLQSSDFSASAVVKLKPSDIGKIVNVGAFKMPSGQIATTITNGVQPLAGVKIQFVRSGGSSTTTSITGNDGMFTSSNRLRAATYSVDVARTGYLQPEKPYNITLPADTSQLSVNIKLPYTFVPLREIRADDDAKAEILFHPSYNPDIHSAVLQYRKSSQTTFTEVPMVRTGNKLSGAIPAQFALEDITYFVLVKEKGNDNGWVSAPATLKPLASGILTRVRVTPELNDQILRINDEYEINFTVFDGINRTMDDKFTGSNPAGQLNVNSIDLQSGISIERAGMNAVFRPVKPGVFRFRIEGRLNGVVITRELTLTVTNAPIREITLTRPSARLASTGTFTYTYSALDSTRRRILLGKNKTWFVEPAERGTVTDGGTFIPASQYTIGNVVIGLRDKNTNLVGKSPVAAMFALVQPTVAATLTDGEGLQLLLPSGSLTTAAEISLLRITPEPTKKYVVPKGGDISYVVSDTTYRIVSTLNEVKSTARLTLPVDRSLRHSEGDLQLAWYNPSKLEWEIQASQAGKRTSGAFFMESEPERPTSITVAGFTNFGQFGILAQNLDLAIRNAAVLPSPFSPDVAPAKIGYILDSQVPPVQVNITIYNMRGEVVRTILKDDAQYPGRYGSRTALKEIVWDGLTDSGRKALNGRYIIEIKARDARGEKRQLLPVVLVK